jgi:hypothetical protein
MLYSYGPALDFGNVDDALVDGDIAKSSAELVARPTDDMIAEELLSNLKRKPIPEA